jgi:alpha-L-fucosidase
MKPLHLLCLISLSALLTYQTFAQNAPSPYGATPSNRQLEWHNVELYGLIHFTPTTFENKEWGYGDADPKIFNPANFDAEQIIKAAKAGGLKGIVLVAKHHDGFALWPTKTTDYNISKSPYKDGKADLVMEFATAARKHGLKFGVYCSPWDRNNPLYGTDKYLAIYQAQLKELYSNYGELFMSWHDGANGGDGYYGGAREKRSIDNTTYYDWENTWAITRKLQPMACIFSDIGWDVRWVGNEQGFASETSWATFTPMPPEGKNVAVPGQANYPQSPAGIRNGKYWMPAECDVPLRKGWFYHPTEKPKTPDQLFDLYMKSVGRGAALDLGLAPNTQGLLHADDVKALSSFGTMLKNTFANNLAIGATVKASQTRGPKFKANYLVDGKKDSYWATSDGINTATLALTFKDEITFDILSFQEYIPLGQRIEQFNVEALVDGKWQKIAEGESIGAKRLIKLDAPLTVKAVRINITKCPAAITLSEIGLFLKAN